MLYGTSHTGVGAMGSISVNKLGALSLIIGPVLALVFFSLQPGSC